MSLAFEITTEDVQNVLNAHGIPSTYEQAEEKLNALDTDAIEKAALYGDDLDLQTEYALQEVEKQLKAAGVIRADAQDLYVPDAE
jgi:hypothetical protein